MSVAVGAGGIDDLTVSVARSCPDVLILDLADAGPEALDRVERIGHLYPAMTCVLMCQNHAPDFLMRAMRAGIREVLPVDADPEAIRAAIDHVVRSRGAEGRREGKIVAFISCKGGGSGATFVAANLAYALAAVEHKKVILVDLNLQWGDAGLFITDKKPVSTLADLATQIHRIDQAFLESSLTSAHANLGVLAAPEDPVHALDIKPEHIDVLLRLARSNYDFVILDVGRALDAVTVRALDYAETIFPVLQVSLPFIRDGKRLLEAFRSLNYGSDKIKLIVNRYEKGGDIRLPEMEQAMGAKAYRTLPNDYDVAANSINQGVPVIKLAGNSAIAKALKDFAHALAAVPATESPGWFARMRGRT